MNKPVWVLDTNVVLDLFYFDAPVTRPLRQAIEAGALACVASHQTLDEWRRVLSYPVFGLDQATQAKVYDRYAERVQNHDLSPDPTLPRCRDPDDQKFLELAASSHANVLVSKDRALLALKGRQRLGFRILAPSQTVGELGGHDAMLAEPHDGTAS